MTVQKSNPSPNAGYNLYISLNFAESVPSAFALPDFRLLDNGSLSSATLGQSAEKFLRRDPRHSCLPVKTRRSSHIAFPLATRAFCKYTDEYEQEDQT